MDRRDGEGRNGTRRDAQAAAGEPAERAAVGASRRAGGSVRPEGRRRASAAGSAEAVAWQVAEPHPAGCSASPVLAELDGEIARLIGLGWTRRQIAGAVHASPDTVKDHTDRIRDHHQACSGLDLRAHQVLVAYLARVSR